MQQIHSFLFGAITLASLAIALFFLQYRKATGDRLFGFFAAAFLLLAVEHVFIEFTGGVYAPYGYLVRLCAFLLLLFAIWDKNRKRAGGG